MTLRRKILIIFGLTLLALIAILWLSSNSDLIVPLLLVGLVGFVLLEKFALRPLAGLAGEIARIGECGDFSERISTQGRDNGAGMAAAVNRMLDALEKTRGQFETESARYRAIIELQSEFIGRFRADGTITFVNDAFCRLVGKPRDELTGTSLRTLIPTDDYERILQQVRVLTPAAPDLPDNEHRIAFPDGRARWLLWNARAIFDAGGRFLECQAVGRDITREKELRSAYRRSVSTIEQAKIEWEGSVDSLEGLILLVDDQGRVVRANRSLEAWSLGSVKAAIGRPLHEVLHPGCSESECALASFLKASLGRVRVGETVETELADPRFEKTVQVRLRTVSLGGRRNGPASAAIAIVLVLDVTARVRAEETLKAVNSQLEEANRQLGMAYARMRDEKDHLKRQLFQEEMGLLLNQEGRIEGVSERLMETLGKSRDRLIGESLREMLEPGYRDDFAWELRQAWMGQSHTFDLQFLDAPVKPQRFEVRMTRLTLSGSRLVLMTLR
ncbi:MAG: PAS domain-containing protein [Syntrophales bacterium]|jgi:PAS domain S-box-containing protein|nr:PAS domain-containing protein [Syntrophales bacterium]HQP28579.1 PAS domain-containing protein [Syntrophales bacterium]